MRSKRFIWFLIMIALGAAGGMAYGWIGNPVQYVDTAPQSLGADYKADYVLMVAEIYDGDRNLLAAEERLAFLGSRPPQQLVSEAILSAQKIGYPLADVEVMGRLMQSLQAAQAPMPQEGQP
jgi:hypothetical protein